MSQQHSSENTYRQTTIGDGSGTGLVLWENAIELLFSHPILQRQLPNDVRSQLWRYRFVRRYGTHRISWDKPIMDKWSCIKWQGEYPPRKRGALTESLKEYKKKKGAKISEKYYESINRNLS